MFQTLQKMDIEEIYINIVKDILNGEKLKAFPLRSGTRQGYSLSPLLRIMFAVGLAYMAFTMLR